MAYNRRCRKTTFGLSNRISFLRSLKDAGASPAPPYPPQYHGPSGEGREFALGLSIAGSAGNDYILGPVSNFGRLDGKVLIHRPPNSFESTVLNASDQMIKPVVSVDRTAKIGLKYLLMSEKGSNHVEISSKIKVNNDDKNSILPMPSYEINSMKK